MRKLSGTALSFHRFSHDLSKAFSALTAAAALGATLGGCSHGAHETTDETGSDHSAKVELSKDPHQETVVILGMNDVHGALAPESAKTKEAEGVPVVPYDRGGAAYLASQIRILKDDFGTRLLLLDAGDEFQGSLESNIEKGAAMVQYFNAIGLNAATIGNHEFDFGAENSQTESDSLGALKKRISEAKYPYVSSNIIDKGTRALPGIPGTVPHYMIKAGGLTIGVIGLTTLETPVTTRQEYVKSLEFMNLKDATLIQADQLRKQGAQIVLVLAHAGLHCDASHSEFKKSKALRAPTDPASDCVDTQTDESREEIVELLHSLPAGTVDAVVSGHSHTLVHHWISGVPVIQGGTRNQYFNLLYLTYDWSQKKLVTDKTRIEGPVPICPKVFAHQKDCNGDRPAPKNGRGELITPVFHGKKVKADSEITALLQPIFDRTAEAKHKVLGNAVRRIEHTRTQESPFGDLVADAIRESVQADVAIMNAGGIRTSLEEGAITYGDVFKALPFDNAISLLTVNGKELKQLLRVAESGVRGWFSVSGVQLRLLDPSVAAPSTDLNGDHQISPWEINRLLDAKFTDGSSIIDSKLYKVATLDFLVTGGDDMGWVMSRIPAARKKLTAGPIMREVVVQSIVAQNDANQKFGGLNSVEHPLIDSAHPRFVFVKPEKSKKSGHGRRKGSRKKRTKNKAGKKPEPA
ncbi:MAG: bifunctional metallophosphatase/5'-nucleotidase [Methylotenera sp.]|nr:bifunctional metallophosphatase/5'-nucleotidase [Oligoflexia bacterium]